MEYILVGGVFYSREFLPGLYQEWTTLDASAGNPLDILGDDPTCPDLTELTAFNALGEERLDGVLVRHFESAPWDRSALSDGITEGTISRSYEFWVDATGRLVQFKESVHERYRYDQDGPLQDTRIQYVYKISGIGEPNVITAPTLPTPTPVAMP